MDGTANDAAAAKEGNDEAIDEFDFLPPVDESLFEASLGGSPLSDLSDETTTAPPTQEPKRPRRRKRVNNHQFEMLSLHEDKAELERRLVDLEQRREGRLQTMSEGALKWEQIAQKQLQLKLKAMRENERLRASIAEQNTLQHALEDIVFKKPRLMMLKMEDDQWRVLKLSADGEKRLNAIHAIADRQLESIDGEMLMLGLVEMTDDLWRVRSGTSPDGILYGEGMRCTLLHGSLAAALDATWKTLLHAHVQPKSSSVLGAFKSYSIDDDTLYVRTAFRCPDGHVKAEMSMIMKKQVVDDVVRVVFRTVLDDEGLPFDADSFVSDRYGWMHMAAEGADVRYKSFVRSNMMDPKQKNVDDLVQLAGALHLEHSVSKTTGDPAEFMLHVFEAAFRAFEAPFMRTFELSNASMRFGWAVDLDRGDALDEFDFLPPVDEALLETSLNGPPAEGGDSLEVLSCCDPPLQESQRRRKRVNTRQVEMLSLHEDKAELERQLVELERRREGRLQTLSASVLKWEQIARTQLQLKLKAIRENESLRATIAEQITLQRELEEIVLKKPRLMMVKMEDNEWRVLKLSAVGEKRLNAIHAITDRQFETMDSEMLLLGLVDTTDDLFIVRHGTSPNGGIYAEGMRCMLLNGSLAFIFDAAWKTLLHTHVQPKASTVLGAFRMYTIDDDTTYVRSAFRNPHGTVKAEMSIILKKQVVDDRVVRIVFRSILDDEGHPFDPNSYVSDQYGWMHLEEAGTKAVRVKMYVRSNMIHPKVEGDADELVKLVAALHLDDKSKTPSWANPTEFMMQVFEAAFRSFDALFLGFVDSTT
ncbi:Aste57867_3179 [Aphanomyces stellatus]|uniref:Aste57867_3179 protein n=1 Tax=Aphanomyces stellatus TaxID=120398 RepID=A0A485K959_9STRA|nr:hypothetical protein As57867_003170 [Aphanomyces stellatus]VFT80353.1 Aste57867_3179 [Aphanomyces stellatus]